VRAAGVELFAAEADARIAAVHGLDTCGVSGASPVPMLTALRALAIEDRERPADTARATLVATLPCAYEGTAATRDVVRTLLRGARRELLVVGFSMTDREFHELLSKRAAEGVSVTVVGDRESGDLATMARGWPPGAGRLEALVEAVPARDEHRRMHGKVIVADRARALIGSANFSVGGLRSNLEFGVRIEGAQADEMCRLIERLRTEAWLVPLASR